MSTETDNNVVLAALERLSSRLDALEAKIDRATGPVAARAARDPQVAAKVDGLLDRLDKLEAAVEVLGTFAQRLPVLSDAAGQVATWAYDQAVQAGVDPIEAGRAGAQLALKAGRPEALALAEGLLADDKLALAQKLLAPQNVALLERLLDAENLARANAALDQGAIVDQALAQSGTLKLVLSAADKVDPADLKVVLEQGAALTGKLAALLKTPELARLVDAGPKAIGVAETASNALVETRGQKVEPLGPFGAFMAMRDPDVQRAVGFSLAVAKRFGAKLQ